MSAPKVTVLMPVHNAAPFLPAAIDSILTQTWSEFELLAVDDGSTDGSAEILRSLRDPRIRLQPTPTNLGIVAALNLGLEHARGDYIARMDADDIAEPTRLARQVAWLDQHPEVSVLGTNFTPFGDRASANSWVRWFDPEDVRIALLFENPICHPTVMLRRQTGTKNAVRYPATHPHAEEYALWVQVGGSVACANLPEPLLRYRVHPQQISVRHSAAQSASIDRLIGEQLDQLGLPRGQRDLRVHHLLGAAFWPRPALERALHAWVDQLIAANQRTHRYDEARFRAQLSQRYAEAIERHRRKLAAMPAVRRVRWQMSAWWQARRPDPR